MPVLEKHADLLNIQQLKDLIAHEKRPCVSLFVPTHTKGPDIQQDPIRLKNQLKEAEKSMAQDGFRDSEAEDILAEGWKLVDQEDVWYYQRETLALFFAPGFFTSLRLPQRIPERVAVDSGFQVMPLIPSVFPDTRFWVLALAQDNIRLLEGSRYTIEEVDLETVPTSLKEFLADTQEIRSLQFTHES